MLNEVRERKYNPIRYPIVQFQCDKDGTKAHSKKHPCRRRGTFLPKDLNDLFPQKVPYYLNHIRVVKTIAKVKSVVILDNCGQNCVLDTTRGCVMATTTTRRPVWRAGSIKRKWGTSACRTRESRAARVMFLHVTVNTVVCFLYRKSSFSQCFREFITSNTPMYTLFCVWLPALCLSDSKHAAGVSRQSAAGSKTAPSKQKRSSATCWYPYSLLLIILYR